MQRYLGSAILCVAVGSAMPAGAAISAADAAKLGGPVFTETGAVKAGNADATIPPYSGKRAPEAKPPASAGKFNYGDPYAADKPLYSIDAKNASKYADKLTEGTKALLAKYPTFRIDVYPTRRDQVFPKDVLENTPKCAQTAKLVGDGDGLEGARLCVPFPLPKTGYEAVWNARLKIGAYPVERFLFKGWLVDSNGNHTLNSTNALVSSSDFNKPGDGEPKYMLRLVNENLAPAGKAGTKDLRWTAIRMDQEEPRAWQYIAGQRRVRLAPEFKYDTVATSTGGLIVFDEINLQDGRMDRFDFTSLKPREIIVPFNTVKSQFLPAEQIDMKNHVNPDHVRWELRRVYEVSAPLKPGARHVYQRKVFYIDQDSWVFVAYDSFDQSGRLYRTALSMPFLRTDIPVVNAQSYVAWDLTKDIWGWALHYHDGFIKEGQAKESDFSPDALAGGGIR